MLRAHVQYYTPEVGGSSVWQVSRKYFAGVIYGQNLSCASYETWNVFPISSLLADRSIDAPVSAKRPKRPRWVRFFSLSYWHPLGTHCPFMSWFWLAPHTMIYFEDAFGMPLTLGVASRPNEFILTLSVGAF